MLLSPLRALQDSRTLLRLRRREEDAFASTIDAHYSGIYRQLWHLCGGDSETAADLTQETFVAAWRALPSFAGRSSLRTWLYTIAVRVWRAHRRRDGEKTACADAVSLDSCVLEIADASTAPDILFQSRATAEAVQSAVLRLPEPMREAVVLHYVQGLRYREVADALEIPIGTVKSRLNAALKRLETMLSDYDPEGFGQRSNG